MQCPNCGTKNAEGESFCTHCGAALVRATAQRNVQRAVDAYHRPKEKKEQKNTLAAVIIVILSLLLIGGLTWLTFVLVETFSSEDSGPVISTPQETEYDFTKNPYYECYKKHNEYVLPSSSTYLSREDLKDLTDEELTIALEELYARHGKKFSDPDLNEYFSRRKWYSPNNATSDLNTYELANQILLEVYVGQKNGNFTQIGNPYLDLFEGLDTYALKDSAKEYLEAEALKDLEEEELILGRSEIYARHGYIFSDPDLQTYFCTKSWYVPTTTAFSESSFNEFESNNIQLIRLYERKLEGVVFTPSNPYSEFYNYGQDYLLSNSNSQELSDSDLSDFSKEECVLARNEIFARHGYVFTDEELLEYFLQQQWYEPGGKIGDQSEIELNSTEKKNAAILQDAENILDSLPEMADLNRDLSVTVNGGKFTVKVPAYWKEYGVWTTENDRIVFYEKLSKNSSQACGGRLVTIGVYAFEDKSYETASFKHLGLLTDADGKQWHLVASLPTDVQAHLCAAPLYGAMQSDLADIYISVLPAEGYTHTP